MPKFIPIVEMFYSIEGEGKRQGHPCMFLRTAGCNLKCSYCDTKYAQLVNDGETKNFDEILSWLYNGKKSSIDYVTLTGGEPLLQMRVPELISEMLNMGLEVNIETNGSIDLNIVLNQINSYQAKNMFFTMDYKLPSSGEMKNMEQLNLRLLRSWDVLKFVVMSQQDMEVARNIVEQWRPKAEVVFSPIHDKCSLEKVAGFLLDNPAMKARMQIQLHKYIWPTVERGV